MGTFAEVKITLKLEGASANYEDLGIVLDIVKRRLDEPQGYRLNNLLEGVVNGINYRVERTGYFTGGREHYTCPECGEESFVEGACPICGFEEEI